VVEDELEYVRRVADLDRKCQPRMAALQLCEQRHDMGRAVGRDAQVAAREGPRTGQHGDRFLFG